MDDLVQVTHRLVLIVCVVTGVPLGTTSPIFDSNVGPQAPAHILERIQRDETAVTSVGQSVDAPVDNASTSTINEPTSTDPKFVITSGNVPPAHSVGDASNGPELQRDMINGLPFHFSNPFPFNFFPMYGFPIIFPFNKSKFGMGVQSSESVWSTVRPGPNGTIVTEVHHQSGNSPPEVVYFLNGAQLKPEAVLSLLQELAKLDETNRDKGKDPNDTSEKPTSGKEGRAIEIEGLMDEVDGKNLRNLIRVLEEIQKRIELFRKDVAEILQPIVLNFNPVLGARPSPNFSKPQTEIESKPKPAPPKIEEKPEKPSNTEETPTKTHVKPEEKPTKTEEKPMKTDVKPEEKPTKTEEKPSKTDVKPEEKPIKTEEKPTKTDVKPEELPTKTEEKPTKTDEKSEEKPIKTGEIPTKTDVKQEEKPSKIDKKPETPSKTDEKPAESSKTNPIPAINSLREARSPSRGYGGPYGGGFFGSRPYYGGGYAGGYPYGGYNGGWRPLYGGYNGLLG